MNSPKSLAPELPGRVIVTSSRNLMTVVIAHSLARRGIEVIACDSVGMTAGQFSKYTKDHFVHADPNKDEATYFVQLLDAIDQHRPDDDRPYVLIPGFRDAKLLAQNAEKFEGKITLAAPEFAMINAVNPKHHLMETLKPLDVPHPQTWQPVSNQSLEDIKNDINMPALIKAVDEVGGRGIEFFEDKEQLLTRARERLTSETPQPIIQTAAKGTDYCFCAIYEHGSLNSYMVYHNLHNKGSEGSAGAMRETIDGSVFVEPANRLMRHLNWHGIVEIDFMWTGEDNDAPLLIEVNPRFWAGLFQSVESGVDFPWLLYQLFAYGHIGMSDHAEIGTKTRIPGLWMRSAVQEALSDNIDLEGAGKSWRKSLNALSAGEARRAVSNLRQTVSRLFDMADAKTQMDNEIYRAKSARSELMLAEDPMISLGALYVISSIIRHGELPAEFKD